MRKAQVHWEALHTFNPAAIVRNGKVYVLYRAEDDTGGECLVLKGQRTHRDNSTSPVNSRRICSRIKYFCTLPVAVVGKPSTNLT